MENNDCTHERREADRQALILVTVLSERVAALIKRFDDYGERQEHIQTTVANKLVDHEKMVIRGMTSWRWIAFLASLIAAGIALSYSEFMELKESVYTHHIESAMREKTQTDINRTVEEQLRKLLGAGHKNAE